MRSSGIVLLALCLAAVAALPSDPERLLGGSAAAISQYPTIAALLSTLDGVTFSQSCAGAVLNNRSILTVANCVSGYAASRWRARVGSSYANSGGVVHAAQSLIIHPQFNTGIALNNDIAILRAATTIVFVTNAVQPVSIAGQGYYVPDNQAVWTAGWSASTWGGQPSEVLEHVQIWTVNQGTCMNNYRGVALNINYVMLCAGYLNVGGRDHCNGGAGSPLYHNGVLIGIRSFGYQCGLPQYPSVNTRIAQFTWWIQSNA